LRPPEALARLAPAIAAATLLERERELAGLRHALSDARRGRGRLVLVEGPAGIGKTSLLRAAAADAVDAGFVGLSARGSELEHDFAYGCVRQLLEPAVVRASSAERERLFAGAAARSMPLLDPAGVSESAPSADASFAMLHGLYWLLNNLADETPLVLVADDLQWADAESVRFLNFVSARLDGVRVAVLASVRTGEKIAEDVARLAASPDTAVLFPGPLSIDATATLCAHKLETDVTRDFAAAAWNATGGNPFFLEALLREARDHAVPAGTPDVDWVKRIAPPAVAQSVLLRLSGSSQAAGALVRALAILGDGAALEEVARLAGCSEDEAARAADVLAALDILAPGETLQFAHPIVREAVCSDIGPRERANVHSRAAEVLAASGAAEERIAAQVAETEPAGDETRVELLRRVARHSLQRGAPTTAVAWLRRALLEPPPEPERPAVLLELGAAELRAAAPEAVEHLTAAVASSREPEAVAMSARLLGNALTWARASDRAVDALDAAARVVEPQNRELALVLEADLAAHAQVASRATRDAATARAARLGDLRGETRAERLVLANLAFERARLSESSAEAAAFLERAFAGGALLDEQELDVPPTIYVLLVGLLATEAIDLADAVLERMLADARARVSVPAVAFVLAHQGVASMRRGAVTRAEADARTAFDLLVAHDITLGTALALAVLIEALIERSDVESAAHVLAQSRFCDEIPPGMPTNPLLEARAVLRLAQGRTSEGIDDLFEFGRRDELTGGANPLASRWRSRAALALATIGDADRARRMAAEDLDRARRWGAASGVGVALRASALVDGEAASVDRLRDATRALEGSVARLEHARALIDLGAALRRGNHRAEARRVLAQGLELADRCDADAVAAHARTELRIAGGRPADGGRGSRQLTASERRVADLAAAGLSNPEIAQTLFVTRKTVETHLGSVYRKLAISGRGKLRDALTEDGAPAR
jgi:ATP/maltotriose-dependent transcriptional regulator MalT